MSVGNCCRLAIAMPLLMSIGTGRLCGQDLPTVVVEVTAVFEDSVYLDKGWVQGISEGDVVRIIVEHGRTIAAKVRSVSSQDARCVPVTGVESIQVGMQGSVTIGEPPSMGVPSQSDQPIPKEGNSEGVVQVDFEEETTHPGAIQRVQVRVTASSGGSVYLNKGRDAGLQPGDEVTFFPPDDGIINGTVQSVSKNSVRCTILSSQRTIDIGTRGEALIPSDRLSPEQEQPTPRRDVPEHPPWTDTPQNWDQNQPLLAPAYAQAASEREVQIHGRMFASYLHTWNQYDNQSQYSLGRIGTAMWIENPFRRGGGLHIDGELNRRGVFLVDDSDNFNGPARLDRLSYYWGGTDDRPLRFEMGRFLSYEFPEFGIIDGSEVVYRTASGHHIGASVGFLPVPFPNLATGDDVNVTAFYRWVSNPDEVLSSAVGYQKTWHKGTPDRDLLIWTTDYDPNDRTSVHSSVWVDFYDFRDTLKTSSAEVTQAIVQPTYRIRPGHGFGANVSAIRWPQLLRREFSPFVNQQIVGDNVVRWGLFTWHDLGERTRVDGRVDQWHDQTPQTGTSWEGRIALRDWLYPNGEVAFALYATQGTYSSGPGGRVSLNRRYRWCFASLWYDVANYQLAAQTGATQTGATQTGAIAMGNDRSGLLQHSVRANLDFTVSSDKSLSLSADYRFGSSQNAIQAGIFFQKRL